jgi:hypothetical protein
MAKDSINYYEYASYLWRIAGDYVRSLMLLRSYRPLKRLETYLAKNYSLPGVNWLGYQVKAIKEEYIRELGKPGNIAQCVQKYNNLKSEARLPVRNSESLLEVVRGVLEDDVNRWLSGDGIKSLQGDENTVQKSISQQIEISLLRKGFRKNELRPAETGEFAVIREPQLKSDKKVDFLVSYGFIGPLIVEIKLTSHKDLGGQIKKKTSYKSMTHYMKGYRADYGIFLVINNNTDVAYQWSDHLAKVSDAYSSIKNVVPIGINPLEAT